MATRPKAVIESRNGEKFSPITIAKNVLTDDGQNLHDILSDRKEDMMTPTIENSSSMFKVGQGDNVDYSANVVNGAYESMVLKGKSMVNCIQESSSQDVVLPYAFEDGQYVTINDTKEGGALGVELKGQTLVNIFQFTSKDDFVSSNALIIEGTAMKFNADGSYQNFWLKNNGLVKANTNYLFILDILENTLVYKDGAKDTDTVLYLTSAVSGSNDSNFFQHGAVIVVSDLKGSTKRFIKKMTSNPTSTGTETLLTRGFLSPNAVSGTLKIKLMIIEYQEGMENWDIPYFEGMTSCKMPILHTVGKNLFDGNLENGSLDIDTGKPSADNSFNRTVNFIRIYPNKEYRLRANGTVNGRVFYYDENKVYISTQLNENRLTNIPSNAKYLKFRIGADILSNGQEIQLEEGSIATPYEQHKSSILSLPEEVVLRSLPNGVCDTFNTRTGVYTQYIVERVLDGSENWRLSGTLPDNTTFTRFDFDISGLLATAKYPLNCDKLPYIFIHSILGGSRAIAQECITNHSGNETLSIVIKKDKLTEVNATGFKQWLSQNPIIVQYELKTPVTTKINLPSTLKSWNTTTHIYSEIPENTLYPILSHSNPTYPVILKPSTKYSIVANSYSNGHTNSAINFNLGGATVSTTVGNRVTTITTPSTLSNELLTMSGRGNKLNNVMVIEGDVVGDEPYFEGICDCKSPILLNCGKNLAKLTRSYTSFGLTFKVIDDTLYVDGTAERILDYYLTTNNCENSKMLNSLEVGTMVTLSNSLGLRNFFGVWRNGTTDDSWFSNTMTIQNGDNNIRCFIRFDQGSTYNNQAIKIQLEATQNPTTYEPYKSNTTTFEQKDDKTIVLRSLPNGVCDTLNIETGEYVQRIKEITFDGSSDENWGLNTVWSSGDYCAFWEENTKDKLPLGYAICDKIPTKEDSELISNGVAIGEGWRYMYQNMYIFIAKNKLSSADTDGLRQYLSHNPITVQYELEIPIVKQVNVEGYPYAYENGHVLLESGSQGQSLTPTIEYSIVANRGGQIRSNQRMVERHQKQLDRLQAIILTNLVNTQYEQTLTNLKYDLKNVREEVK